MGRAPLANIRGLNLETCPDCGGRMRMVAALTEPASVKTDLDGVGLDSEIPNLNPARSPPQTERDDDCGA